jgi:hypothetical protein
MKVTLVGALAIAGLVVLLVLLAHFLSNRDENVSKQNGS